MSTIEEVREQARKLDEPLRRAGNRAAWYQTGELELIEAARKSLRALLDATEPPAKAVKPAEDEREALIATRKLVHEVLEQSRTLPLDVQSAQVMLVLLDAGYSKRPRPITDEMVDAGAKALNNAGWTYEGADEPGCWCEDCQAVCIPPARAILEAAEEARR